LKIELLKLTFSTPEVSLNVWFPLFEFYCYYYLYFP